MSTKNTEWKRLPLTKERLDFSGAQHAQLESDGDNFLTSTFDTDEEAEGALGSHEGEIKEIQVIVDEPKLLPATDEIPF